MTADPGEDASDVDAFIHLLSLPRALRLGEAAVGRRTGTSAPSRRRRDSWRQRVAGETGFKVGLAWAGNAARSGDESGSLAVEVVAPLAAAGACVGGSPFQAASTDPCRGRSR